MLGLGWSLPHRLFSSDKIPFGGSAKDWWVCGTAKLRILPLFCQSQVFSVNFVFLPCCFSSPMSLWSGSGETLTHSLFLFYKHPNPWEIAEPPPPPFLLLFAV